MSLYKRDLVLMFGRSPAIGSQKAIIHPEGGIEFETYVGHKIGWVAEDEAISQELNNLCVFVMSSLKATGKIG